MSNILNNCELKGNNHCKDQLLMTRTIKTESEFFQDQLPVIVKTESESPPNEHNIMDSIKVEVKEEHFDDQDCVVKCELDFDEGEQINRKIKVEDVSSGQLVQHCKCVKKEEEGGEYVMECDCEECEICRVKMEMKEEPEQSGFETELGGNSGLVIEGGTRVKKEEEDGEVERPNKIQRMDRVVGNVQVGSPSSGSNVMSINVEYIDDQVVTSSTHLITIEDHTQPSKPVTIPLPSSVVTPTQSSIGQHLNKPLRDELLNAELRMDNVALVVEVRADEFEREQIDQDDEDEGDQCDAAFNRHSNLVAHLRIHTGSCPFVCTWPESGQAFTTSSHLKTHSSVHSNERKFVCDVRGCTKVYKRKDTLRKHQMDKHN